jgi:molybdate transport system substrate-binding protein
VTRALALALAMALAGFVAGCGEGRDPRATGTAGTPRLSGSLRVFAASSLTQVFTSLGRTFERRHPGVRVVSNFNFAASSSLARQINDGAPADVFASADMATMRAVTAVGGARAATTFARNRIELIVGRDNPKHIAGLADLDRPGMKFAVCAPEVPCGALAAAALRRAGVRASPVSLEANVKAVVSRVMLGEVDTGIVYRTDVKAAGKDAVGVPIDIAAASELEAVCQVAVTRNAPNPRAAAAWVALVRSPEGRRALTAHGFRVP